MQGSKDAGKGNCAASLRPELLRCVAALAKPGGAEPPPVHMLGDAFMRGSCLSLWKKGEKVLRWGLRADTLFSRTAIVAPGGWATV